MIKKVITTHKNMDLDALGAVIAVKKLYPDTTVVLPGTKGKDVLKVLKENPHLIEYIDETGFDDEDIETVIVVDTPDINRIPETLKEKLKKNNSTKIIIYDHHSKEPTGFKNEKIYFKEVGAATSLLTMILKGKKIIPSPLEASIMALGIYSDTGKFLFPGTTPLDLIAAGYLFSIGANPETIKHYLPKELTPEELDILKALQDNMEIKEINGNTVAITTTRFERYAGDIAHLVSKLLEINNYPALIAIVSIDGATFIICRSKTPLIDVSKVAETIGGGGHPEAASAVVRDKTLYEVKETVINILKNTVQPAKIAKDIMSSPPTILTEDTDVKSALSFLMKQGINAAPVIDANGNISGIVNRNLTDKAIHMGMESEPIHIIMERDFEQVEPETAVDEIEDIIVNNQQTLVPVTENGKVTGIITRTDILINLYKNVIDESQRFYRKRLTSTPGYKNVKQILKEKLPDEIYKLLEKIGEIADKEKINAYVIGGFVRDLIIGRKNLDVDVVVEGDAPAFAKKIAKELKGSLHTFEKFKTATVTINNGFKIDFASARTEIYHAPGALPEVDTAPLKKDLFRRDFTINTLAIKINRKDFGKLIDFFNGLKDIKEKKIRVLHALSFVEDPTRILRALRFAIRYRFDIGKHTEKLLRIAVNKNLFRTVEGKRVYLELKHIFEEDNPLRIVNKMKEYDILKSISQGINWDKRKKDLFERIRKVINWHKLTFGNRKKVVYPTLYFAAFLEGVPGKELNRLFQNLSIPDDELKIIKNLIYRGKQLVKQIEKGNFTNSALYKLLKSEKDEMLLYIAAKTENEKLMLKLLDLVGEWKEMKLAITGNDLKSFGLKPGPEFRKILENLKEKVIDKKIGNTYEELIENLKQELSKTS